MTVMHVRMAVSNDSDATPWIVDSREQLIEVEGRGRSGPVFVNGDRATLPVVQIARRDQRVFELYYPLPEGTTTADDLASFQLLWQVRTGQRLVGQRTSFDRTSLEPAYDVYGFGPYWWGDPFWYSGYGFTLVNNDRPSVIRNQPRVIASRQSRGSYVGRMP
jgi:hypothetical protein